MSAEKEKDDRTRVVSVRMTEDEIAVLPPADSESARVRLALATAREVGAVIDGVPKIATAMTSVKADLARLSARVDAQFGALGTRLQTIAGGDDAFHRVALEADARDVETSVCDVWAVCMAIWRQTLNNHLSITLIREALVDGSVDPDVLLQQRLDRLAQQETDDFRDYLDRAEWMLGVTDTWRQMRQDERAAQVARAQDDESTTPAAAE
jgi:hypothetical protein